MNIITLMNEVDKFDKRSKDIQGSPLENARSLKAAYRRFTGKSTHEARAQQLHDAVIIVSMIRQLIIR